MTYPQKYRRLGDIIISMKKPLIYGLIGIAVLIIIILVIPSPKSPVDETNPNASSTENQTPGETPTITPPTSNPPSSANQTPKPTTQPTSRVISITSPAVDARFDIGTLNVIKWSQESGMVSSLYLVDASNDTTLGVITPTITSHQTSYSWDTKDVSLSRQSGVKKSVTPGKYYIKMKFDGPIKEATSNIFFILYPEQDTSFSHNLTIKDFRFSPASIAVRIGEKVVIQNKDQNTYTLTPKSFGESITITPGETKVILTGSYPEGPQGFYSEKYSATNLTLNIYK